MCKMIIHYRIYLQNSLTNTFAMPKNFYHASNQIQTLFNCYIVIYSDKWMYYYSMVFKLKDTVPDVQDDHPLHNISSEWYYKHICNAHTRNQIQTPFICYIDINSDKWMYYYIMVFKLNDTVPDVQDDHSLQNISSE